MEDKEKRKIWNKTYADGHREIKNECQRRYYEAHKDEIRERQKEYYKKNKEHIIQKNKEYMQSEEKKAHRREYVREYRARKKAEAANKLNDDNNSITE